jgi:hypothetical protein
MRLVHGLEAGSWGIYRRISDERARAIGVVTYEMLIEMVERREGDVLIESDRYGLLAFASNEEQTERMQAAIRRGYVERESFPNMPDWGDTRVYTRRP